MSRYVIQTDDIIPGFDPNTFQPTVVHPILYFDFNNLKVVPKPEINEWLKRLFQDSWSCKPCSDGYCIEFEDDTDLTLFILTWIK